MSDTDPELAALREYANKTEAGLPPADATTPAGAAAELPDVETMIANLASRLEKQPGDVNGWIALGWSYLSMGRPEEAAKAYETALKLAPGATDIEKALAAARSASALHPSATPAGSATPASLPVADGMNAGGRSNQDPMVRGMI